MPSDVLLALKENHVFTPALCRLSIHCPVPVSGMAVLHVVPDCANKPKEASKAKNRGASLFIELRFHFEGYLRNLELNES